MTIERLRSDVLFPANRHVLAEAERYAPQLDAGAEIEGLIHPREGLLLYVLARRAAKIGDIVEIGAYKGRSTWYLARALADEGSQRKVISVDPHESDEQRAAYFETLERSGLRDRVEPVVAYSHDALATVTGPVGMLWIDGDHRYTTVRRDVDEWFPRLSVGGWYAMHDTVNAWHGPTRTARELLRRAELRHIGVMWVTLFGQKATRSIRSRAATARGRAAFEFLTLAQARRSGFGPTHHETGER